MPAAGRQAGGIPASSPRQHTPPCVASTRMATREIELRNVPPRLAAVPTIAMTPGSISNDGSRLASAVPQKAPNEAPIIIEGINNPDRG